MTDEPSTTDYGRPDDTYGHYADCGHACPCYKAGVHMARREAEEEARYVLPQPDHLHDMIVEAMQRFATEDGCTVAEWAGRAVRFVAVHRLDGEAKWGGHDTLSAQKRPPRVLPPNDGPQP